MNVLPKNAMSIADVREALELVDGFSQRAFDRIASIAWLCRSALNVAPGALPAARYAELGHALAAIEDLAKEAMNDINVEAERVGCNFVSRRQQSS